MAVDRAAFEVVDRFEQRLAEYTGAPYCVTVDSCTNALLLCFARMRRTSVAGFKHVRLPKFTYVGVVQSAINAGLSVEFIDQPWVGEYQIQGTGIWDAARWLRRGMYPPKSGQGMPESGAWMCLSFQATKHLPIGRGGAILCDNKFDAAGFRLMRFDGRNQEKSIFDQEVFSPGYHVYLPPDAAARGLWLMNGLKDHNDPLPGVYPDLSKVKFT